MKRACALFLLFALPSWAQLPRPVDIKETASHFGIRGWADTARIGRTVTVATSRGDYSTLTAAVAYVTTQTPSAPAPWTILVYDGDHSAETFTVPPYVAVIYLGGIDPDGDRSGLAVQTGTGYDFALKVTGSTNIAGGGGGNYFETIDTPAGTDPVADSSSDTLAITCSGLTCTGNAATDTVALAIAADGVALGSQTSGGYAASTTEAGPATTATALAANGSNCSAGSWSGGVDASGAAEGCTADDDTPEAAEFGALALTGPVTSSGLATTIAANAVALGTQTTGGYAASTTEGGPATTASALAANGANCSAGQLAAGVDASGAAEGCTAAGDVVGPASTVDNTIPRYDGTTGKLLQSSSVTMTDAGGLALPAGSDVAPAVAIGAGVGLNAPSSDNFNISTVGTNRVNISSSGIKTQNGAWVQNLSTGSPVFTIPNGDTDSGLGSNGANDAAMWAGGSQVARWLLVTSGVTRALVVGQRADTPQAATCADSGDGSPGALTINPTSSLVYVTVSDADGCTVTMGETNVVSGMALELVVIAGSATFSDTAAVTELAGSFTAGVYDVLDLRYIADRWVETGRSDN